MRKTQPSRGRLSLSTGLRIRSSRPGTGFFAAGQSGCPDEGPRVAAMRLGGAGWRQSEIKRDINAPNAIAGRTSAALDAGSAGQPLGTP